MKLTRAITAKAGQIDHGISANLETVKKHADQITQDPFETTHANSIRKAAGILTDAMQNMQKAKYPNLSGRADEDRDAANSIKPDVLTLEQRESVKTFFGKSADLLRNMN